MARRFLGFLLMPVPAAVGFLIGGLVVFFGGFFLTQTRHDLFAIIEQGYSNFGIELVSIAITVLVIDNLNQRRSNRERLQELITQMRSKENGLALAALEILKLKGWLQDGSLTGVLLTDANLRDANLRGADLTGADLRGADLRGANLIWADLPEANLAEANLTGANLIDAKLWEIRLTEANLRGANLTGADLTGANLTGADLTGVSYDKTIMPDGKAWTPDTDMSRFTNPLE